MNKLLKIVLSLTLGFVAQSAFACDYPSRVLIPNGNTATKEEMIDGQRGVKQYVADMAPGIRSIAQVILGSGFAADAARAVVTGQYLLKRPEYKWKLFTEVPPAATWIAARSAPRALEIQTAARRLLEA